MIKETLLKKMENLIGMSIFYKRSGKMSCVALEYIRKKEKFFTMRQSL